MWNTWTGVRTNVLLFFCPPSVLQKYKEVTMRKSLRACNARAGPSIEGTGKGKGKGKKDKDKGKGKKDKEKETDKRI